ncbi:MAG: ABC transporter permease, partial [Lachnospiraceae bacterium]
MKFLKKIPLQRGKGISKPVGIAAFTVLMLIMAALIVLHHNPLADPQQELIKKIIACVIILAAILVFGFLYDKITVLPMELYQNRRLI